MLLAAGQTEWQQFLTDLSAIRPTPRYLKAYNLFSNGATFWGQAVDEFRLGLASGDRRHFDRAALAVRAGQANDALFEQELQAIGPA